MIKWAGQAMSAKSSQPTANNNNIQPRIPTSSELTKVGTAVMDALKAPQTLPPPLAASYTEGCATFIRCRGRVKTGAKCHVPESDSPSGSNDADPESPQDPEPR